MSYNITFSRLLSKFSNNGKIWCWGEEHKEKHYFRVIEINISLIIRA